MRLAGDAPAFVKIDIEGYEYAIPGEIARLRGYHVRGVQLAVHPQLYEKSLRGPLPVRRLRAAWSTWRLGRIFVGFLPGPRLARFRGLFTYVIVGVLFRRKPKGADLVFERGNP
jgi:hypothetical protein